MDPPVDKAVVGHCVRDPGQGEKGSDQDGRHARESTNRDQNLSPVCTCSRTKHVVRQAKSKLNVSGNDSKEERKYYSPLAAKAAGSPEVSEISLYLTMSVRTAETEMYKTVTMVIEHRVATGRDLQNAGSARGEPISRGNAS